VIQLSNQLFRSRTLGDPCHVSMPAATSTPDGYRVQAALLDRHIEAGDSLTGYKIGLTSPAARATYGAREPVWGFLLKSATGPATAAGLRRAPVARAQKIEAELAFLMGDDVPAADVSPHDIVDATKKLFIAAEIVETRWRGVADLGGLIADDVSNAAVALGTEAAPSEAVAANVRGEVRAAGRVSRGRISDVMGGPARSVAWLASALAHHGRQLRAGDLVMSGTLCSPLTVSAAEDVTVDFGRLGQLQLTGVTE
jgi:2-keto-4-pentenoate hydratase